MPRARGWQKQVNAYAEAAPLIFRDRPDAIVMSLNAPGWWYTTRNPGMQTPSNGPEAALAAAARYGATHLLLEPALPAAWQAFAAQQEADPRFELLGTVDGYRIYRVHSPPVAD